MRILMHCMYFPPEVGGLESHVYHLCRGLAERGHEVGIVTSRSLADTPAYEVMGGVRVWRTWFPARSPAGWVGHALASIPRTVREARGADILHAQAFASIPPMQVARWTSGAPLVSTFHTSHFLVRARRPAWRPILRQLVRAGDHVLAASTEIAEVAEALTPGKGVEALTNGVDTGLFRRVAASRTAPGVRYLVVPRRLYPKNGVETLVRALPRILEGSRGVEALIVGDGPERTRLEALSEELGVREQIHFLGARPHTEMPGILSSAQLAVVPSLMEATSVAALESMACELPVVASDVGGLPEIVDETVGALVPPADPDALAAGVLALLNDPEREAKGARGRARVVEMWSNARLVERHLEIYEALLARGRGRR